MLNFKSLLKDIACTDFQICLKTYSKVCYKTKIHIKFSADLMKNQNSNLKQKKSAYQYNIKFHHNYFIISIISSI